MNLKIAAAITAVSMGGCTSISPFISHMSHPDRGWPADQRDEWSLDIVGIEGEARLNNWELSLAPGYVYTPGEPQPWVVNATLRYRIPIGTARCTTDTQCRDMFGGNGGPEPRRVEF